MYTHGVLRGRWWTASILAVAVALVLAGLISWSGHLAVAATNDPASDPAPDTSFGNGVVFDANGCASGHFCIYTGTNFTGTEFQLRCNTTYTLNNFAGIDGSWDNNCGSSVSEQLIKSDGAVILTTANGGHILRHFDYSDIRTVHPI
jgi:hypothetical protein